MRRERSTTPRPTTPDPELVQALRSLLDRLRSSRRLSGDDQERISDQVSAAARRLLRRAEARKVAFEALAEAIGSDKGRRREGVAIHCELLGFPDTVARAVKEMGKLPPGWRMEVIQVMGLRGKEVVAPFLNEVMLRDSVCRAKAIEAAGHLQSSTNAPVLARMVKRAEPELQGFLLCALPSFGLPEARKFFRDQFKKVVNEWERILAAWGLAKLGDAAALAYLERAVIEGPHRGMETLSAARAICDVNEWPFHSKAGVAACVNRTRKLVAGRSRARD